MGKGKSGCTRLGRCIAPSGRADKSVCSILTPSKNGRNGPIQTIPGKNRIDGCDGTEILVVLPLGIIRIDEKTARYGPFFAENQFSPADEFVLVGLVVRKCHFDVTACAEARQLAQRAERSLRDLSALWASRRASRAGWIRVC